MDPPATRDALMREWEEGWGCIFNAIDSLKPEDVMRIVSIRGARRIDAFLARIGAQK